MEINKNSTGEVQGNLEGIVQEQEVLRGQALGLQKSVGEEVSITFCYLESGESKSKTVDGTLKVVTNEGVSIETKEGYSTFIEYFGGAAWPQFIEKIEIAPEEVVYDVKCAPNVLYKMFMLVMGKSEANLKSYSFGKKGREILFGGFSENPQESHIQTESVKYKPDRDISEYLSIEPDLIKEGLFDKWKEFVAKNTQFPHSGVDSTIISEKDLLKYSKAIVEGVYSTMRALGGGKTPKEALHSTENSGLTLFMLGEMAQAVYMFSPRGEEFKDYWNSLYLSPEKLATAKGVVNPALYRKDN